uniref:Uncharacterized protein n=1 Tax=Cucumis sativus TaxID=3659 RepID=A0A0A0L9E7_CUCSA
MSWRSMGTKCSTKCLCKIGRSREWTNSWRDSTVSCRNFAEWNSMLVVFLCLCQISPSALKIPSPRRSWTVSRKKEPFGYLRNSVFRMCSMLRGSEVTTQFKLLNHGPLNLKVPF